MLLEPDKDITDFNGTAQGGNCIGYGLVFQFQQAGQFLLIKFRYTLSNIMGEHDKKIALFCLN